jgi:hypothetical protein
VYLKSIIPKKDFYILDPIDFATKFHPHLIDDERVNKFIFLIQRTYHERLFPYIGDTHEAVLPGLFLIGYAIELGKTKVFKNQICLSDIRPSMKPPQSFQYLDETTLALMETLGNHE